MGSEVIIIPIIIGAIFGIFYLYFSTRNKERLALIEKGADASIFKKGKEHTAPIWKVLILNIALLLMGIGIGSLIALLIKNYTTLGEGIYPACIFTVAGAALYAGFTLTKKLDE